MKHLVTALALLLAPAAAQAQRVESAFNGADPFALAAGGRTWVYPTDTGRGGKLFAWSSADRVHWTRADAPLIELKHIPWIADDGASVHLLWAPHVIAARGKVYLYYSVGPQNPTPSRIGVAICAALAGPCVDSGKPLVNDGGKGFEAIDPAVFVDPKSKLAYLYAGGSAGSTLRVWVLKPDLVSIDHEVPVAQPPRFTEGVFMHERRGVYYLSYSVGRWNTSGYQVHYATSRSPTGPWRYRGAILQGDATIKGPGHHSFFRDSRDGQWYIAYHRWEGKDGDGPYQGQRRVAIQKLRYRADGTIVPVKVD
ncbi:MAG: family 43 glycosylhydrolase [Novosphingobium sp.]|nr:family 43 glycosylhydrolase [Novosphingobium sp.]